MCGTPTAVGGGGCGAIAVLTDFGRLLSRVATAHLTFLVEGREPHDTVIATAQPEDAMRFCVAALLAAVVAGGFGPTRKTDDTLEKLRSEFVLAFNAKDAAKVA